MKIAAVVLTENGSRHIGECLATLGWADERAVFDSFSNDDIFGIARQLGQGRIAPDKAKALPSAYERVAYLND